MALKKLTTREMVEHGAVLVSGESPEREALESIPEAVALLPALERAHAGLLAAQPPSDSEIAKLTEELAELDARHDDLVRGIDDRCASEASLSTDKQAKQRIAQTRGTLFPTGRAIVQRSYTEEAGEAKLREARVTPEMRNTLQNMKTVDGDTLDDRYLELQNVASSIGAKEKQRAQIDAEGTELGRNGMARNAWIRAVNALAAVLEVAGVDEAPILGRIREAEVKAEQRTRTPATDPSPPPPVDPTPA